MPAPTIIAKGATLKDFPLPSGRNIVLTLPDYASNPAYIGNTVGRIANRIAGAHINNLAGRAWPLTPNDGTNSLHGGAAGWSAAEWRDAGAGRWTHTSAHLDEGFPGAVDVAVTYTASATAHGTRIEIDVEARLVGDDGVDETCVNVTNHR